MKSTMEAERMERLNKAFARRTSAVAAYKQSMKQLREGSTQGLSDLRGEKLMEWAQLNFKAANERNDELREQYARDAAACLQQAQNFADQRDLYGEADEAARETLRDELADIDREIAALGGNLSTPKIGDDHVSR